MYELHVGKSAKGIKHKYLVRILLSGNKFLILITHVTPILHNYAR